MIDEITYGFVKPTTVGDVLRDFLNAQQQRGAAGSAAAAGPVEGELRMCLCSSCVAGGARAVYEEAAAEIDRLGLRAQLKTVGCTGISYQTPLLEIALNDGRRFQYGMVQARDVRAILLRHFRPVAASRRLGAAVASVLERLLTDETWEPVTRYAVDLRHGPDSLYVGSQQHLATEHCGELDPLDIEAYIQRGGFEALETCLKERSQDAVIGEIEESGLRGRGGAGFPTGQKWGFVWAESAEPKYIVCNGDEGDPGAFMDRMILESFPFRVIEGMAIAAYAVGAREGYMYIRAEYPLATHRVKEALRLCEARGFIGADILGTGHSLRLKVVEGAGAFVCGEETALMAAIEGRRGMPRIRPPFPSQQGLWGKPTLVNNVETYALVSWIIRHGAAAFAKLGTERSKGTKAFALAGKVVRGGLIEVPMGITLHEIVEEIGGGIQDGRTFKAVQVGGPSGGCVPAERAHTPVDYYELVSAGAIMGSGGMVVLDDSDCMVDIARYFLSFTQLESCGKCTFCRIGTKRMLEILERLCGGQGKPGDLEEIEFLARATQRGSLCGLGKTAPNPVLSTLRHFRGEYEAHIEGRCPAKKCKALIQYRVTDACIGCTQCAQQCPVQAIERRPYEKHAIDVEKCTRCDACRQGCPVQAIEVADLRSANPPPETGNWKLET
ncbi:MAG: NADH-quinone oxidoreductase subunit NuoF [Kiritimatiellae bacterium]|nr:NADH-quinone oxidoreductase subunit NuoF [Kiritimatiellia bacterium]